MPAPKDGRGVYLAHSPDMTVIVPFGNELECLRFAVENQLTYKRAPYGQNLMSTPNVARPARKRRTRKPAPPTGLLGSEEPATGDYYLPGEEPPSVDAPVEAGPPAPGVDCDCQGDGDLHPRGSGGCQFARGGMWPANWTPADVGQLDPADTVTATDLLGSIQAGLDEARLREARRTEGHPGGLDEFMASRAAARAESALGITPDAEQ